MVYAWAGAASAQTIESPVILQNDLRPQLRPALQRQNIWDHVPGNEIWTYSALGALQGHGQVLLMTQPKDVIDWCPNYIAGGIEARASFWVGLLAALAKHESTWRPAAVGGNGRWYGLVQILPATARGYGCAATSGKDLLNGSANLSCAIRILAVTIPRDEVISHKDRKWRGVAADWGPMRVASKRAQMRNVMRTQPYCRLPNDTRPRLRPGQDD